MSTREKYKKTCFKIYCLNLRLFELSNYHLSCSSFQNCENVELKGDKLNCRFLDWLVVFHNNLIISSRKRNLSMFFFNRLFTRGFDDFIIKLYCKFPASTSSMVTPAYLNVLHAQKPKIKNSPRGTWQE